MSEILQEHRRDTTKSVSPKRKQWVGGGLAVAAVLGLAGLEANDALRNNGSAPAGCAVTVENGETLWDIASVVAPNVPKDTGEIKSDILAINTDVSGTLAVGEHLSIPQPFCASLKSHQGFTESSQQ
jgi:hypothetical protein